MRELTWQQQTELERIASRWPKARVVGWALGGPVLQVRDALLALRPFGTLVNVGPLEPGATEVR